METAIHGGIKKALLNKLFVDSVVSVYQRYADPLMNRETCVLITRESFRVHAPRLTRQLDRRRVGTASLEVDAGFESRVRLERKCANCLENCCFQLLFRLAEEKQFYMF